ncbi:MAG: HDOD domain-containing protein [Nitrospirales bacterium]
MKRRILFVDDEPNLLEGLKRILRPFRHEWEMGFVGNGAAALVSLEQNHWDVVVSDVRMPGMNGVELLNEVRKRHPQTIRILLSGQADKQLIFDAIGPAHQYLAKPCDGEFLRATISRACALGDLLQDKNIKQLISKIESIPSLPSLYLQLEKELQSCESSIEKAAAIVGKDIGMTAKILKLVNSAFLGIPLTVTDPIQAVRYLGLDTLKTLVLTFKIFEQLGQNGCVGFDMNRFWSHCLSTGEQARKIAKEEKSDPPIVEAALAGGLLHDVGMLLFLTYFPDRYQEALKNFTNRECSLMESERETFGTTHAEVGAYLLGLWGLPNSIMEAVAFHHQPIESSDQTITPLTVVQVANGLAEEKDSHILEGDSLFFERELLPESSFANRLQTWRELP